MPDAGTVNRRDHWPRACVLAQHPELQKQGTAELIVGIRPEELEDSAFATDIPEDQCLTAKVRLVEALGSDMMVHFGIQASTIDAGDPDAVKELSEEGANVVGRFHRGSSVEPGATIKVAVTTQNLHFFDPTTRERTN